MSPKAPRGPRMRVINIASAALAVVLALLFSMAMRSIAGANEDLKRATEKYVASELAATTFKQSSDNLTTQVRLYTVTRDMTYLRAYFAEVDSFNRERAVETLTEYLAGTEAHRYLENALDCSVQLMEREYYAMALVLDATGEQAEEETLKSVSLSGEDRALSPEDKCERAVSLVHDEGYLRYDKTIDENVSGCIESLASERETVQRQSLWTLSRMQTNQGICAALLVITILLRGILTTVYVERPLEDGVRLLTRDQPLPMRGAYELQYLESAYNTMYGQRKEWESLVQERMRALDLLERERTSLGIVHQMLQSGMWSMDFNEAGEMTAVFWSDQFRKMLGYESEADFPNTLESWSNLLHEEDKDRVLREFHDTIADYSGQKTYDVEYRLLTKQRGWRWFHAAGRLSRRPDGSPVTYVGLFMDITDRKEMEAQLVEKQHRLEEALVQAQAANRAKTVFLTNMSHDMRTPMNAIIGFTTLARAQMDNPAPTRDYLEKISASGGHLLSLIDDLLDMSRIESGQMELREQECALSDVLRGVEAMVQGDAKHLTFQMDIGEIGDSRVICDKTRLSQVLLNVLSNAVKFTPAGGTVTLRARALSEAGQSVYEFRIRDTGIGMSREFQQHIFDAFERERTSTVSGLAGTGLGLPITKNLVDLMGGEIRVESQEGQGTEVTVTLPLRRVESPSQPDGPEELPSFAGKSVLLVEDNPINQEISRMILESSGFTVDLAEDGSVAVEKVRSARPGQYDLILMDIQMPVMDGYEATRQIRALDSPLSRVPIIALSANTLEEDKRSAIHAGMNEHLGKPIDVEHFLSVLGQYLP